MKKLTVFLILVSIAITTTAQTKLIPFQARLTDAGNQVVPDNVYNIVFKVYDAATGGTPLWSENHLNVSVIGGQINVLLGSLTPLNFTFEADKFLAITIGTGPEMVPRHQLVPSFHAQSASLAHEAEKLGGKEPAWYASKDHVAQKIADTTADIQALSDSLIPTVTTHTTQINDISSDVDTNKSSVLNNNGRLAYIENRVNSTSPNVYVTAPYCSYTGLLTTAPTCRTPVCSTDMITVYYRCNGHCGHIEPQTCNNTLVGNLAKPE